MHLIGEGNHVAVRATLKSETKADRDEFYPAVEAFTSSGQYEHEFGLAPPFRVRGGAYR